MKLSQLMPLAAFLAFFTGRGLQAQTSSPLLSATQAQPALNTVSPRQEARALWVVRFALESPESIHRVVTYAKAHRFNVLIVQARGRGDAYYHSDLEPRAESLSKQPPDFDPLAQIIQEGHAQGLQVHAWLNSFFVWSGAKLPKSPQHVVNAHPDWLLTDRQGTTLYTSGPDREGAFMDPGVSEGRQWVHDVFLDVARRYDVDGIHFDFIRYPGSDYGFSDSDLRAFKASMEPDLTLEQKTALDAAPDRNVYPTFFPERWGQWRRDNVTDLVRRVYHDVKAIKPGIAVSAALIPWGVYHSWKETDAYNRVSQDWFGWMGEGILDVAVPMTYHTDTPSFSGWVRAVVENRFNTQVWTGIGAYLITPESAAEKIEAERRLGAQGFSLFSYESVTQDGTDDSYLQKVEALALPDTAIVPPIKTTLPTPLESDASQAAP